MVCREMLWFSYKKSTSVFLIYTTSNDSFISTTLFCERHQVQFEFSRSSDAQPITGLCAHLFSHLLKKTEIDLRI
uniref:Uncharacterized protein n=1 Tax=Anguilla anguilla TaxID=7936 RepID=A0A0E9QVE8_ANGAN